VRVLVRQHGHGTEQLCHPQRASDSICQEQHRSDIPFVCLLVNVVGSALSAFTAFNNSYIAGNTKAYYPQVSVVACASICARDPTCLSFEAGIGGRSGDCFISTVNRTSPGVVFQQNKYVHLDALSCI
jgi:hypothetical protein